jgi:hypothetical protein
MRFRFNSNIMGLDLTLIPMGHDSTEWGFGHELINLERNYDLFDKLQKLPTSAVPLHFSTFRAVGANGEVRYGDTQSTPYGDQLRAVTMAQLKAMQIEGAAGAFIAASPDRQRVALFWH